MSIYANHVDVSVCSFGSLHFTLPFRHKLNNKKYIFIHLYTLKLTHNGIENILPHIYATNFLQISCHIYIVIVSPTVCLCIVVRYSSIYFFARSLFSLFYCIGLYIAIIISLQRRRLVIVSISVKIVANITYTYLSDLFLI